LKYHEDQWENPKTSTSALLQFLNLELASATSVLDLGCGAGAAISQIARGFPNCKFVGIDHSARLIEVASENAKLRAINNVEFIKGDILNLEVRNSDVDGVTCIQTISWLEDFRPLIREIVAQVQPSWIALTGLFYQGNITAKVEIIEHERGTNTFFNVYALPEIGRFVGPLGYKISSYQPFEMDFDLPKPKDFDVMQTYTETVVSDYQTKRIQLSGPLLINSGFLKLVRF
jgi:ubiquinone/menaquinone biosynthesis C-methylase UbiE